MNNFTFSCNFNFPDPGIVKSGHKNPNNQKHKTSQFQDGPAVACVAVEAGRAERGRGRVGILPAAKRLPHSLHHVGSRSDASHAGPADGDIEEWWVGTFGVFVSQMLGRGCSATEWPKCEVAGRISEQMGTRASQFPLPGCSRPSLQREVLHRLAFCASRLQGGSAPAVVVESPLRRRGSWQWKEGGAAGMVLSISLAHWA